jgi:hypothetical protein
MKSQKLKICGTLAVWFSFFCTPFVFILGLILGVFTAGYFNIESRSSLGVATDIFSSFVLLLTLIVVGVYTHFAKKQNEELISQKKLSTLPSLSLAPSFLTMDLRDIDSQCLDGFWCLKATGSLSNVGNGAAINVSITISHNQLKVANFKCLDLNIIFPGRHKDNVPIDLKFTEKFKDLNAAKSSYKESFEDITIDIILEFQDIEGNWYRQRNYIKEYTGFHGPVESIERKFQAS